jgi:hypothetical protein
MQVKALMQLRYSYADLKIKARKDKMPVRRRSFDFGEECDEMEGINKILNIPYEEKHKIQTTYDIKTDLVNMENSIILAQLKYGKSDEELLRDLPKVGYLISHDNRASKSTPEVVSSSSDWRVGSDYVTIWKEYYSEDTPYYYNDVTGESIWEYPSDPNSQVLSQYQDERDGKWYWYNYSTGESYVMEY